MNEKVVGIGETKIKIINSRNVPEIYSDYTIVTVEDGNVSIRFYKQRPILKEEYSVDYIGALRDFDQEPQAIECILQASLILPLNAGSDLIDNLDNSGVKLIKCSHERFGPGGIYSEDDEGGQETK